MRIENDRHAAYQFVHDTVEHRFKLRVEASVGAVVFECGAGNAFAKIGGCLFQAKFGERFGHEVVGDAAHFYLRGINVPKTTTITANF